MDKQWWLASGYAVIFAAPGLLILGGTIHHPALAFATVLLLFPLARPVFGEWPKEAILWREPLATALDWLPVAYAIALLAAIVRLLVQLEQGSVRTATDAFGLGLSLWITFLLATCPAHELIHRRSSWEARVGRWLGAICGYPLLGAEHLAHHARRGDTESAEWPRLNESMWAFSLRRIRRLFGRRNLHTAFARRRTRSRRVGAGLMETATVTAITWLAFAVAGGWGGFLVYLGVFIGVTIGYQAITYLQHWGLGIDSVQDGAEVAYGWEDACRFQAWLTMNVSFHLSHHRESRRSYYRLELTPGSPRQPASYVVLLVLSMVPPLWRKLMLPVLAQWKSRPLEAVVPGRRLTCFGLHDVPGPVAGQL